MEYEGTKSDGMTSVKSGNKWTKVNLKQWEYVGNLRG